VLGAWLCKVKEHCLLVKQISPFYEKKTKILVPARALWSSVLTEIQLTFQQASSAAAVFGTLDRCGVFLLGGEAQNAQMRLCLLKMESSPMIALPTWLKFGSMIGRQEVMELWLPLW